MIIIFFYLYYISTMNQFFAYLHFPLQVGIDKNLMEYVKDDLDFTQKLISAKSVFCLPGSVSEPIFCS